MSARPNSPLQTTTNERYLTSIIHAFQGSRQRFEEKKMIREQLLNVQNTIVYMQAMEEDNSIEEYLLRRLQARQIERPSQ